MITNIECDSVKLREAAQSITDDICSIETIINDFFKTLQNIPANGAWIGQNAEKYSTNVLLDKEYYLDYLAGIKAIAAEMTDFADEMDKHVTDNQNKVGV